MIKKKYIAATVILLVGVSAILFLKNRFSEICIEELEPSGTECLETKAFKYCFPTLVYNNMEICGAFDAFQYLEEHCLQGKLRACEALITGYGHKGDKVNAMKWNVYSCALAEKQGVSSSFECE